MYDMYPYFHMRNMEKFMFMYEYVPMSYTKYQKFYFHMKYIPIASYKKHQKILFSYMKYAPILIYVM